MGIPGLQKVENEGLNHTINLQVNDIKDDLIIKVDYLSPENNELTELGFAYTKISSLSSNGGSFLYPGQMYPVFLANRGCLMG